MNKKILAMLLCLCMVMTMMPMTAFAVSDKNEIMHFRSAELSPATHTFADIPGENYGEITAQVFTVTNTGNESLNGLTASLSADSKFKISEDLSASNLAPGDSATVSVRPKTGLRESGTFTDILTISDATGSLTTASLSVKLKGIFYIGTSSFSMNENQSGTNWIWSADAKTLTLENGFSEDEIGIYCWSMDNAKLVVNGIATINGSLYCNGNLEIVGPGTLNIAPPDGRNYALFCLNHLILSGGIVNASLTNANANANGSALTTAWIDITGDAIVNATTDGIGLRAIMASLSDITINTSGTVTVNTNGLNRLAIMAYQQYDEFGGNVILQKGAVTVNTTSGRYIGGRVAQTAGTLTCNKNGTMDQAYNVSGTGLSAPWTGLGIYGEGTTVGLNTGNRPGYTFKQWSSTDAPLDNPTLQNNPVAFIMPAKDVTVTAEWVSTTPTSGGASTGSGSTNSGSGNIPPVIVTPDSSNPNNAITTTIDVKADSTGHVLISDRNMVDAISMAQAAAQKSGMEKNGIAVEIKVDMKDNIKANLSVNLTNKTVEALTKANVKELRINSGMGIIKLDLETLKTIQKQINGPVNISMTKVEGTTLSKETKAIVGNRPVFEFIMMGENGQRVTEFGKGKVSITLPYVLGMDEKAENIIAYYIDNEGNVQEMANSMYDEKSKTLSFVTGHFSMFAVGYKENKVTRFYDITNHWAKGDIEFLSARGLFSGTGGDAFSPDVAMTRGMFVTLLGRLAKADVSIYKESGFADVKGNAYYMGAIEWANKNGMVKGINQEKFAPDQAITREQMVAIMANYAEWLDFQLPKLKEGNIFADNEKISEYAKKPVEKMQLAGLISGKNQNKFDPKVPATRAEVSTACKRFVELIEKK